MLIDIEIIALFVWFDPICVLLVNSLVFCLPEFFVFSEIHLEYLSSDCCVDFEIFQ